MRRWVIQAGPNTANPALLRRSCVCAWLVAASAAPAAPTVPACVVVVSRRSSRSDRVREPPRLHALSLRAPQQWRTICEPSAVLVRARNPVGRVAVALSFAPLHLCAMAIPLWASPARELPGGSRDAQI